MYGKGKITNRYAGETIPEQIMRERLTLRPFDGSLMLKNNEGLTFTQHISNTSTETKRIVLFGGQFSSVDDLNSVLGEAAYSLLGRDTKADIIVSSPVRTKAAQDFFNANPTRISRLEIMVDTAHVSQLNNNLIIRQYHPARNLGSYEQNLQIEIRTTNTIANKVVCYPKSQIDGQTIYLIDVVAGATLDITYVLGAAINLPARLDLEYANAIGEGY